MSNTEPKLQVKYVAVATLVANPNNARQHSAEQVEQIAKSIRQFGFNNPLLIDDDHRLIAGHGRLQAANSLGLKKVPCISLAHLNAEQQRAFAIADNKIPLNATWDLDMLTKELEFLDSMDFDLKSVGFSDKELDDLLRSTNALLETPVLSPAPVPQAPMLDDLEDDEDGEQNEPEDDWLTGQDEPEEEAAPTVSAPKMSDAKHSVFDIVMDHSNKLLLIETLNNIRRDRHYEKLEDALMLLVKAYREGKLEV